MRFASHPHRAFFLGLCLAAAPAFGQTAPAAAAPGSSGDLVKLQPFDVSASSVNGYAASESSTGTRVATQIADLPFVVNVVTDKFLNDFDFFQIGSNLAYTSSLADVDTEGNYFLRGFPATFYVWNGFYRLGLVDRVNLARIEVIKGPVASIYGQTSPAGLVNMITKAPSDTPYQDLQLITGSFDTTRVEGHIDTATTVAGLKLANLISFDGMDLKGDTPFFYQHQRSFNDALKTTLNDHSVLTLEVDWTKTLSNTGDMEGLFDFNSVTKNYTGALAPLALARFSQGGPNERQNREMTTFYANYENRLSDVWSLRLGEYGYDRHNSEVYNGVSNEFDPGLNEVVGISQKPTRTILNEDGGASQADLLAHYWLFDHSVENKTLLTLDWSENWRFRQGTTLPSTLQNLLPSFQNPNNPVYNTVPDYGAWTVVNRNDKVRWDTDGIFAHEQANLFDDTLLLFAGLRHDQVTYNLDFGNQFTSKAPFGIATPGQVEHFVNAAWTPSGGANYKLTKNLALYGNYSQSFQASAQVAKLGDPELPNTRGNGVDYGVKCNFLDDRLVFTLGGYYVTETGLKISQVDPVTGITETVAGGSQNSKGVETDLTYQVSDDLGLTAGGGLINARLVNEGTDTLADGKRPPNVPVSTFYVATNYNLKSLGLRGWFVNAGLHYDGVSSPEPTASTAVEARLRLPAYWTVDAGVHYQSSPETSATSR